MKTSLKTLLCSFAAVGIVGAGVSLAAPALTHGQERDEKEGSMPAPVAKISPVKAMKVAEASSGDKAASANFEYDDGQWLYGVVVVKAHQLMEVEVDAATGKVLETEKTTPESEAKELKSDLEHLLKK